jgi:hypothetical protein
VVPRPRGGVRGSGTSGGSVDATVLSRLDQTREPREDSRILSKGIIKERFLERVSLGIWESRGSRDRLLFLRQGETAETSAFSPSPEPRRKLDQRSTTRCVVGSRGKSIWPH